MKNFLKNTKGSIALISMLVIASFVLLLAVGMAENSISTGYQYVNNSMDSISSNYAEGCFEEAIHRIEQDSAFSGYTFNFTDGNCIISVAGTNPKTIDVTLNYLDYSQTFRGTVDITQVGHALNATLSTWTEI
ncbi:MAG: hypothetical protein Q8P62_04130 [Candidatus Peregrinibacteria bacterium]|nr:hypothetical protein [Candidatus Peregrinibacteria bacterium]